MEYKDILWTGPRVHVRFMRGGRKEEGGERQAPIKAWPYKAGLINWN